MLFLSLTTTLTVVITLGFP